MGVLCRMWLQGMGRGIAQNMAYALKLVAEINDKTTPTEKLRCLEQAITCITDDATVAVSADELVPLLALLVIRSDIPNWLVNIHYMKSFQLARVLPEHLAYLLVSLEAAVTHILNNGLDGIAWYPRLPTAVSPKTLVHPGTTPETQPETPPVHVTVAEHVTGTEESGVAPATSDTDPPSASHDLSDGPVFSDALESPGTDIANDRRGAVAPQGSSSAGYYSAGEDNEGDASPQMQRARHGSGLEVFGTPMGTPDRQRSGPDTDTDHTSTDADQAPTDAASTRDSASLESAHAAPNAHAESSTPPPEAHTPTHDDGAGTPQAISPLDATPPISPPYAPSHRTGAGTGAVPPATPTSAAQQKSIVARFLKDVGAGDVDKVRVGLETAKAVFDESALCHPLCECVRCHDLKVTFEYKQRAVSVHTVDADGCRAIHIAARLGNVDVSVDAHRLVTGCGSRLRAFRSHLELMHEQGDRRCLRGHCAMIIKSKRPLQYRSSRHRRGHRMHGFVCM